MVNTEPIKKYIESRDAMKANDKETALRLLCQSMGVAKPTPYMISAIKELTEINEVALTLVLHKCKGVPDG